MRVCVGNNSLTFLSESDMLDVYNLRKAGEIFIMEKQHRQQILIVDDEEINRVVLKQIFQEDYDVLEAANGQDAIYQIENNENIILILLDVVMPVKDG